MKWIDDLVVRILDPFDQVGPVVHAGFGLGQVETVEQNAIEALARQIERHLIDAADVAGRDDRLLVHIAEEGDLGLQVLVERPVRAAEQDIGRDADRPEVAHAVLRRFRFQFAARGDEGDEREVDIERVLAAEVLAQLTDRFEKRLAFDVADRAADLNE